MIAGSGNGGVWRVCVDTGGTFTDCLGVDPLGRIHRAKVLSTSALRARVRGVSASGARLDWAGNGRALVGMRARRVGPSDDLGLVAAFDPRGAAVRLEGPGHLDPGTIIEFFAPEEAPVLGARMLTGTAVGEALPPIEMRLGTTRGTNALLERRGAPVALFLTRGFGDLLTIGTQQRPDLFALRIEKPPPVHSCTVEVTGRIDARGAELSPLDLEGLARRAREVVAQGVTCAAVALLHSWVNPSHEQAVARVLREAGFEHVSVSSALSPAIRVLPRAQTAVVNAFLAPVIEPYLRSIERSLGGGRVRVMTSAGGLVAAGSFAPKDCLLSGPAGGLIGAAAAGHAAGFERIIALDMGGTSTDVSRYEGRGPEYTFEHRVGDAEVMSPALAIESVAAGGGSECWVDGDMLAVGPRSAGASPGPACYGAGGPLTITDCNLLLGRLAPEGFQIPVDESPARARLAERAAELEQATGVRQDPEALPEAWLEIALERMAEAMRRVSVRRGYEPADHALVAFGGAGPQVACGLATRLGMSRVVIPVDAGLLSARGLQAARVERFAQRQALRGLDECAPELPAWLDALETEAAAQLREEGVADTEVLRRIASLRLSGQEATLDVEAGAAPDASALSQGFAERYKSMYGHAPAARTIEVESLRVVVVEIRRDATGTEAEERQTRTVSAVPPSTRLARFRGQWVRTPVYRRDALTVGAALDGPALVLEGHTTVVVEPGWRCRIHPSGAIVLESSTTPDAPATPLRIEVSTGRLASIASDMGEMLRRTAVSTNVKERLDFSCAILDPEGRLVVNAPHVPVHLGSLGVCVREVVRALPLGPGDVAITNHPGFGGSHLPDITVITPVFACDTLIAYVASRAHHAEIGGIRPGSMPVGAASLTEEGVVIPPRLLVRAGRGLWDEIEALLRAGPWPSRAVADNLADLRAQVAANRQGADALDAFVGCTGGTPVPLTAAMEALATRARASARRAIGLLAAHDQPRRANEFLDDGSPIRVSMSARPNGTATIDFTGSAGVHPGSFNATEAIVRSAVIYVLRLLVDEPVPLNEGLLGSVDVLIPRGMLAPDFPADPTRCPAVAAGNVETCQRVVDTLLKALGLAACGQGTMNNLVFGNDRFGYYETICGGAGAGPGFAGADAVHTHMTNTRITDPEILEHRYPVRLERFAVRRGSGGTGRWRGGDGIVREMTFLEPCIVSLITQHRASGPFGVEGGAAGAPGAQRIVRMGGPAEGEPLPAVADVMVARGDRLILETPGGGGWGRPQRAAARPR